MEVQEDFKELLALLNANVETCRPRSLPYALSDHAMYRDTPGTWLIRAERTRKRCRILDAPILNLRFGNLGH